MKKLKTLYAITCFAVLSNVGICQNLVPNPSFEILDSCPEPFTGDVLFIQGWNSPTVGSPDIYSNCNTNSHFFHTPDNWAGFQLTNSGDNYAGIITMQESDAREYIQIALTDSLILGEQYCVEFYVSIADSSAYASNNIGAYFSTVPISVGNPFYLSYLPQINNPISNKLDDKNTWGKISGTFIANGGEKFMTIGNFNVDSNTDTTDFSDPAIWINASYHYIDDVSVVNCDSASLNKSKQDNFKIYPNPVDDKISIEMDHLSELVSIELINSVGKSYPLNFDKMAFTGNKITTDLSYYVQGVYYLLIKTKNNTITKKIIIN